MRLSALFLLAALALAACSKAELIERFASPADQAAAQEYIDLLRQKEFDRIEQAMSAEIKSSGDLRATLEKMAATIPEGAPVSRKVVGANTLKTPEHTTRNITFEYEFPGQWLLVNVALRASATETQVIGFNVYPIPDSLENTHRFTLAGKSTAHYVMLALAVLIPAFIIYVLVVCVRTPIPKRKWLWIVFIILGFGQLTLNWTSGGFQVTPLSFQLLGAGTMSALYGPWMVSISLPIGAIVFLIWRRFRRAPELPAATA